MTIGSSGEPCLPDYKCKKGIYKDAMRKAFKDAGIKPQLGGVEYGDKIAGEIDLYEAGKANAGFRQFIDALKDFFQSIKRKT